MLSRCSSRAGLFRYGDTREPWLPDSWGLVWFLIALQWVENYCAFHVLFLFLGSVIRDLYSLHSFHHHGDVRSSSRWGRVIGIHDSAASAAIFSAPILIALGLQFLPWKNILLLLGIVSLILPFFFWKVSIEPKPRMPHRGSHYIHLFTRKPIWIMAVLCVLSSASNMGVYSMLPLYLIKERGMEILLCQQSRWDFKDWRDCGSDLHRISLSIVMGIKRMLIA